MAEQPRIFSIKEINKYIRMKMDVDPILSDVFIRGEISNFTHHSSGHMYFSLKDKDSRIKCVMFASYNARLPFIPKEGTKVLARGNITVFERDGAYQFYAMNMQPDGIGSLYLAYEQLKQKLQLEGLFDLERKRPIPKYPAAVGVITSPTGAAVQDILTTIKRRYPLIPIYIYPVLVQGEQAAPSICKAIEALNRHQICDVLIVGRGGGSLEELWAFNEEMVARSIAASQIPIISAVGHETDFTIADFTSDLRAATPTAAAELAVPDQSELKRQISRLQDRMRIALKQQTVISGNRLERIKQLPVFSRPQQYLLDQSERLDRVVMSISGSINQQLKWQSSRSEQAGARLKRVHPSELVNQRIKQLENVKKDIVQAMQIQQKEKKHTLISYIKQLDALSPLKVMARGYSLVYGADNKGLIASASDVEAGDNVRIKLADGELDCSVLFVRSEDNGN